MNKTPEEKIQAFKNGFRMWMDLSRHLEYLTKSYSKYFHLNKSYTNKTAFCHFYLKVESDFIYNCDKCPLDYSGSIGCELFNQYAKTDGKTKSRTARIIAKNFLKHILELERLE